MQELVGSRRNEYEVAQHLLGIMKERMYPQQTPQRETVIVYLEADDPEQVLSRLVTSELPFDRWFKQQIHDLHLTRLPLEASSELVLEWQASTKHKKEMGT